MKYDNFHPEKYRDGQVSIHIKKRNIPSEIDLAYEASGIDHLFIIIWKIATATNDTIWFLNQPELHLHPGAQKLLYDFLKDQSKEGKQIFVATQSMVFIHKSAPNEVSIILSSDNTFITSLEDLIEAERLTTGESEGYNIVRNHIYDALGYESKFSFEPDTVVIVEGTADKGIITAFSKTLGKEIDLRSVRFIPMGDKGKIEKYVPILAYTLLNKRCLIVIDNDNKKPEDFKKQILEKENQYKQVIKARPVLGEENFILYPEYVYSIEYFLLEAQAITNAATVETNQRTIDEIKREIDSVCQDIREKKVKPKDALKSIWEKKFGPYKEVDTAIDIAKHISREHLHNSPEIIKLIEEINKSLT